MKFENVVPKETKVAMVVSLVVTVGIIVAVFFFRI